MAITAQQKANLLGVTSFMFNFAPDQASYARFEARIEANPSFYALGTDLARTEAYTSQFAEGATRAEKIDLILGRLGLTEGEGYERGVNFINQRLDAGIPEGQVLMEIGEKLLQDTPPTGLEDAAAILKNKMAASEAYLESGIEGYSSETLPDLLANITADAASVEEAQAAIDAVANEGETVSLTADADDLTGTANDDTFTAGLTAAGVQTLQTFDRIDGGEGTDTLRATLDGGQAFDTAGDFSTAVTNVENFYFRALATESVDMTGVTNVNQVWADRLLGQLTVDGLAAVTTLGVVQGEENTFNIEYVEGAVDAALDNNDRVAQSVVLQNADVTLQIDEATTGTGSFAAATGGATLNAALTGDNTVVIDTIATTGEGSIDLDVTAQIADIDWDVTLGAGDDRLAIEGTELNADDSIDMGEGDDVLALAGLNTAGDLDTLVLSGVSNVEGLEFIANAALTDGGSETLSLGSFDNVTFGGTLTSAAATTGDSTLVLDTDAAALEANFEGNVGSAVANEGVNLTVSEEVESLTLNAESSDVVLNGLTNAAAAADNSTESLTSLTLADTSVEDPATGTLTASTFVVTLTDLDGLTTLNLAGIAGTDSNEVDYASSITVEADAANFAGPVTISIAEGDVNYDNATSDKREIFQFNGEEIGTIVIGDDNAFTVTAAGNGDKLDFSQFAGVDSIEDLAITGDGTDWVISAADGQFEGTITLAGIGGVEQSTLEANAFIF